MAFKDILLTLTSYPDQPRSRSPRMRIIAASFDAHLAAVACEVHVEVPGHFLSGSIATFPDHRGRNRKEPQQREGHAGRIRRRREQRLDSSRDQLEKCPTFAVPDLLVDYARLRDLTIVPVPECYDQWYAEALIFGSGRPTLVLPESPRPRPFELGTAVVAWDFSRAAARAVSDAFPLLERPGRYGSSSSPTKKSWIQAFRRSTGQEPGSPRHRRAARQGRRRRPADRRGSRSLHRFRIRSTSL